MTTAENWRPWPREPWFAVSDQGRVRSGTGHILACKARPSDRHKFTPYRVASMSRLGRKLRALVHVMVCETFHGPRPDGMEAAHVNGNSLDDRVDNVVWATRRENQRDHVIAQGRLGPFTPYKLTNAQVDDLRERRRSGEILQSLSDSFGISLSCVYWHTSDLKPRPRGRPRIERPERVRRPMGRPRRLTDEQIEALRARRSGGELLKSLAASFGVSIHCVWTNTRDSQAVAPC